MELGDFDFRGNACVFARKNFVVREETSHEREEKRTHAIVRFGSVNGRTVVTRHGGAGAKRIGLSSNVGSGLSVTSMSVVVASLVIVRKSNVLAREQGRDLINNGRRASVNGIRAELAAVTGNTATCETFAISDLLDTRDNIRQ